MIANGSRLCRVQQEEIFDRRSYSAARVVLKEAHSLPDAKKRRCVLRRIAEMGEYCDLEIMPSR